MSTTKSLLHLRRLIIAGICLAIALLLPFLTGQIPTIGSMLAPMHLPVLLCGFLCGWPYGLAVGAAAPLLRFAFFGMPPLLPTGLAMVFELAAYGVAAAVFYRLLPKKPGYVYLALVGAMLAGRLVWGVASFFIYMAMGNAFTLALFFTAGFARAVPGIICHILLIPPIVIALRHARFIE